MEVIFTDRFLDRVEEFSDYIALDNIPKAVTWAEEIFSICQKLQTNPHMGRMVPEFRRPEIRELIHDSYRLIHEVKTSQIDMLTIGIQVNNFQANPKIYRDSSHLHSCIRSIRKLHSSPSR